jgi:hypothetical protein
MPAVERMAKLQLPRVQHVPGKAAAAPIERITENRAAQALQMNPNLMGPASIDSDFEERKLAEIRSNPCLYLIVSDRIAAIAAPGSHPRSADGITTD